MVLTQLQTTAFFESHDQLGIPHETMVQIQREGIQAVADLADFEKQELKQLADNLRKPGGRILDPNPNAAPGATIPMPAFTYGAKSQKRLTVACDLVRYYQTMGRDLTSANIQWNQVMSNFEIQWKALKDRKDEDDPEVPTITKALPIIKWTEAFQDFLHRVIGARMIPLAYVIRADPQVPGTAPTLAPNQPHSTEHGSVEEELMARASHTHALFRDDNSLVYYHLEKAKKESPKKSKSSMKKQVASLVEAALNKSVKFDDQVNDEEKYIMSMVQAAVTKTLNQKNDQQSKEKPQVTLKSILKHAKNNGSS